MLRLAVLFFIAFVVSSCNRPGDHSGSADSLAADTVLTNDSDSAAIDYDDYFKLETYLVTSNIPSDTTKVHTFDKDGVLIVFPDDQQIESMREEYGEDFETIIDDASYYHSEANQKIDSVGVHKESTSKQFVKFVGEKGTWTIDIRKKGLPEWNLIFFKKSKEPFVISSIDVTQDQVREFFELKK